MEIEWVNIKDRLPGRREKVLFVCGFNIQKGVFMPEYITENGDFENIFRGDDQGFYITAADTITHWMPLPELPK